MNFLPFIICIVIFIFSTIGFFLTQNKTEKIYGAISILSVACAIVQAAIVF